MDDNLKRKILNIYTEFKTVYGPYTRKEDGRNIVILYDGKKRSARQFAKVKLEAKLGRKLNEDEEVDHVNDIITDDRVFNLQILSPFDNRSKSAKKYSDKEMTGHCPQCNISFPKNYITQEFCSKSCSSKYNFGNLGEIMGLGRPLY